MANLKSTQMPATAFNSAGSSSAPGLGSALATGLGQGLQVLMQDKLDKMVQSKQVAKEKAAFEAMGLPGALANLNPASQKAAMSIFQNMSYNKQFDDPLPPPPPKKDIIDRTDTIKSRLQTLTPEGRPFSPWSQDQPTTPEGRPFSPWSPQKAVPTKMQPAPTRQDRFQQILRNPNLKPEHRLKIEQMAQQERLAESKMAQTDKRMAQQERLAERLAERQASTSDKRFAYQERLADRQASASDKRLAFAETRKYREAAATAAENARGDLQNLKMQKSLIKAGRMMGPKEAAFLDVVGNALGLPENAKTAFKNSDTTVFEKLSIPYFRDLKVKFGGKPTQYEAELLQKSFPSLYQSKEGQLVIIDFMEHDAENNDKKVEIIDDIIRENRNIPPLDLASQTAKRLAPWQANRYLKLRARVAKVLSHDFAPDLSAAEAGKGTMLKSDAGGIFKSDGKKWNLLLPDSEGE